VLCNDVEIPSDLYGVYNELDDRREWKLGLAQELKAAELKIRRMRCYNTRAFLLAAPRSCSSAFR
jgi:hypothetical protein